VSVALMAAELALQQLRPVWAEVSLNNLDANLRSLYAAAGRRLCAVIKADGYGHGSIVLGKRALALTVPTEEGVVEPVAGLAVATVSEALLLRNSGMRRESDWFLLLLGETYKGCEDLLVQQDIQVSVGALARLHEFADAAKRLAVPCRVHLKLDTGMGRVGFREEEFAACLTALAAGGYGCACWHARRGSQAPAAAAACGWACWLEVEGVYSHCAQADEADFGPTRKQARLFSEALDALRGIGVEPRWRHLFNSAFTIQNRHILEAKEFQPLLSSLTLARVGISMYGHVPSDEVQLGDVVLAPLMTWKARITHVKCLPQGERVSYGGLYAAPAGGAVIATVPVGYADGYRREVGYTSDYSASVCPAEEQWHVLVRGQRVPIAGRVCMDMIMLDVSGLHPAPLAGEEVVLLGKMGDREVSCEDWARRLRTINYEITCLVGARVPRVYLSGGEIHAIRTLGQITQF